YQYFEPADDPNELADIMIQKIGALGAGDLPPTLDVETTGKQTPQTIAQNIHIWMDKVEKGTGRKPIIYTGRYFWNDNVTSGDFADYPLWLPAWGVKCPNTPDAWSGWRLWQHSSTGTVSGITGNVDLDLFNGTKDDLDGFAAPANQDPRGNL